MGRSHEWWNGGIEDPIPDLEDDEDVMDRESAWETARQAAMVLIGVIFVAALALWIVNIK